MISENSAKKNKQGVSIAPLQYAKLSDFELERALLNEIRKNPNLVK